MQSKYVDAIAPHHSRTSCDDDHLYNAAYSINDHGGFGRCYRCTLLAAAHNGELGLDYISDEQED